MAQPEPQPVLERPAPELPPPERKPNVAQRAYRLFVYAGRRFAHDRSFRVAASLSYTTLLSLVPLAAIGLAVLSAFPVFDDVRADLQSAVIQSFVPAAGDVVAKQFSGFLANTAGLTAVGTIALAVTALLLLNTIEAAFNAIWRVERPRAPVARVLTYWAILTLTPLLVGTSMALSSYIFTLTRLVGVDAFVGPAGQALRVLPFLLMVVGFAVLYMIIPNRRPQVWYALAGGTVAAVLFEVLKRLFAWYVVNFPSYQAIYGAVAAVPLFLVWMYLSWSVVLFGAHVAASLGEPPEADADADREDDIPAEPAAQLLLALGLLSLLVAANREGETVSEDDLVDGVESDPRHVVPVLERLARAKIIVRAESEEWLLARDPGTASLHLVYDALGLVPRPGLAPGAMRHPRWRGIRSALTDLGEATRLGLETDLRSLLDVVDGPGDEEAESAPRDSQQSEAAGS